MMVSDTLSRLILEEHLMLTWEYIIESSAKICQDDHFYLRTEAGYPTNLVRNFFQILLPRFALAAVGAELLLIFCHRRARHIPSIATFVPPRFRQNWQTLTVTVGYSVSSSSECFIPTTSRPLIGSTNSEKSGWSFTLGACSEED